VENESQDWVDLARARIAARGKVRPSTKAGAVRALWPVIEAALANGQSLKRVRDWLEEEGVYLTYNQLTSYAGRIRRATKKIESAQLKAEKVNTKAQDSTLTSVEQLDAAFERKSPEAESSHDPIANIRSREQKRPTFEYDPNFNEDELI